MGLKQQHRKFKGLARFVRQVLVFQISLADLLGKKIQQVHKLSSHQSKSQTSFSQYLFLKQQAFKV